MIIDALILISLHLTAALIGAWSAHVRLAHDARIALADTRHRLLPSGAGELMPPRMLTAGDIIERRKHTPYRGKPRKV